MVVRNDLHNTTLYNKAVEVYRKNEKKYLDLYFFGLIFSLIVYCIFKFIIRNPDYMDEQYISAIATFFSAIGYFGTKSKLGNKNFSIYQIKVEEKIFANQDETCGYITENGLRYGIKNSWLVHLEINKTYLFLAEGKMLYSVIKPVRENTNNES